MHVGLAAIFQNPGKTRSRLRGLPGGAAPRRSRRAARLRVGVGRRASLHRLHHVPGRAAVPHLHGGAHRAHAARLHGRRAALARSPARRGGSRHARQPVAAAGSSSGWGAARARWSSTASGSRWTIPAPRFVESAQMLLRGLETGYCEHDGIFVKQPRVAVRPAPFKSFRGRTYAAAVSPESARIMAELGVGMLIIPQKPWPEVAKELDDYRDALPPDQRSGRAAARLRGLDLLRRERGAGARAGPPLHRRLLPDRARALPVRRRSPRQDQGLRVLRQDDRQDPHLRRGQDHRLLRGPAGVGHARAVLREDPGHPAAHREQPLRGRVLVRRHAGGRGGAQHAPLRREGHARAAASRSSFPPEPVAR